MYGYFSRDGKPCKNMCIFSETFVNNGLGMLVEYVKTNVSDLEHMHIYIHKQFASEKCKNHCISKIYH